MRASGAELTRDQIYGRLRLLDEHHPLVLYGRDLPLVHKTPGDTPHDHADNSHSNEEFHQGHAPLRATRSGREVSHSYSATIVEALSACRSFCQKTVTVTVFMLVAGVFAATDVTRLYML